MGFGIMIGIMVEINFHWLSAELFNTEYKKQQFALTVKENLVNTNNLNIMQNYIYISIQRQKKLSLMKNMQTHANCKDGRN